MAISPVIQKRVELAGYSFTDPNFRKEAPWTRFAYVLCTISIAVGTGLTLPALLWAVVPLAAIGAILPFHPFDLIYDLGVRRLMGTPPLLRQGAPRRFACGVAAGWLVATALAFQLGVAPAGYALGGAMVVLASLVSLTYICVTSIVYALAFGKPAAQTA